MAYRIAGIDVHNKDAGGGSSRRSVYEPKYARSIRGGFVQEEKIFVLLRKYESVVHRHSGLGLAGAMGLVAVIGASTSAGDGLSAIRSIPCRD